MGGGGVGAKLIQCVFSANIRSRIIYDDKTLFPPPMVQNSQGLGKFSQRSGAISKLQVIPSL